MTCDICDGKANLLYEDEHIAIAHAAEATRGHIRIYPKAHITKIEDVADSIIEHLFFSGSYAASILFELLGAHGTNIILREGGHAAIDVIERKQDDGLNLLWKPKQIPPDDMDAILKKVKDALIIGQQPADDAPIEVSTDTKKIEQTKDNYLIRSLDRIP